MSLAELPTEIFLEIISYIPRPRRQAALASVNSSLHRAVLPVLYSRPVPCAAKNPLHLLRALVSRAELSTHIRTLDIRIDDSSPVDLAEVFTEKGRTRLGAIVERWGLPCESHLVASLDGTNHGAVWALILALAPNVERLLLPTNSEPGHPRRLEHRFKYLGKVFGLPRELASTQPGGILSNLKTLELKGILFCRNGTPSSNLHRVLCCPSLRKVVFDSCMFILDVRGPLDFTFDESSSGVTDLQFFHTEGGAKDFEPVINACKTLTSFRFLRRYAWPSLVPADLARAVARHASTLVDLRLHIFDESQPRELGGSATSRYYRRIAEGKQTTNRELTPIASLRPFDHLQHLDINLGLLPPPDSAQHEPDPGQQESHDAWDRPSVFPASIETLALCRDQAVPTQPCVRDYLCGDVKRPPRLREVLVFPPRLPSRVSVKRLWRIFQKSEAREGFERDMRQAGIRVQCLRWGKDGAWYKRSQERKGN